ncbi:DUF4396 domain-containing protein [Histidinibacterium aquaticum]|uniref:DUF4396 domain-containing protein n=1 Tax=Histidinibacterium aquaticum TaxID=2613962 RepID=A0A5J5GL65_9RHOB|nr:DUF4396 domain-containing protein [Histidinibacterium aquaticum]KAA9008284.1 DUF4396 domain-containing protein [Histidinibacterium aquaticum]
MVPYWLELLAIVSLLAGFVSAAIVIFDLRRHPQHMWIMNLVWPLVALFAHVAALVAYYRVGRLAEHAKAHAAMEKGETPPHTAQTSFPTKVGKGASHCGAGCTLGDICAEWLAVLFPVIAVWLGYESIFQNKIFAVWILDYIFAFTFGVAFQYFTIVPMRGLSPGKGVIEAVKADVLSLTAWQVGMYGFMAVAHFWIFGHLLGAELHTASVEFWFMMQIAMICGFLTSYPVNWWLIRKGVKEAM